MANSTIPGLVAVSVPALTDLFGVRQSGDSRDKKLTVTQLLTLIPSGGDVTKVGTPVDNELGVWTGDGTLEGDTNLQWSGSRLTIAASGLILPAGSAAGPSQVFTGSLATGWYTPVANVISASIAGVQRWSFQADKFNSAGDGGALNFTATDVIPGCIPRGTDLNTGIGGNGADTLTAIAGGLAGQFWNETNAGVLSGYASSPTVTAFATGGQGGATVLINSYNIVTTVATTGDSVRLQATHDLGSVVYCKNEGANSLDIFPASGDDLGAGLNTAVAIPAGEFKCFITTVAQSTWTELLPFAGGGGDVTKVGTPVNNQIGVWTGDGTLEGDANLAWSGTILTVGGTIQVANSGGGAILNEQVTSTNPSLIVDRGDVDTGFGSGGTNNLAVIVGGQTYATYFATGAGDGSLNATYDLTTGKTASTTQTQGQAVQNSPEYSEITTVANPNDVITLGNAAIGRKITVVNRGANVLQIFPGSGGDLGQGVNASTTLAVDHSLTWLGLAGGVWSVVGFSDDQAGAGDVIKVGTPVNNQIGIWTGDGTIEGLTDLTFDGSNLSVNGGIAIAGADRPKMVDVAPSSTVPVFTPNAGDVNTGIGGGGGDQFNLICGGVSVAILSELASNVQFAVPLQDNAAAPSIAFGDKDTGFYENADDFLSVAVAGVRRFAFSTTAFQGVTAGAAQLLDEVASATNPTLIPHNGNDNTGIGRFGADALSLIAGGVEGIRVAEAAAVITNLLFGTTSMNIAGGPALQSEAATFNNPSVLPNKSDDDTGIGYGGADVLDLIAGASNRVRLTSGDSVFRGDWNANTASGPALLDEGASSTNPTIVPNQADDDTGIGRDAVDSLAFIAGGVSCMRVREIAAAPAVGFYTTTPIVQQTGVAVTDVAIHAALVALGLITA